MIKTLFNLLVFSLIVGVNCTILKSVPEPVERDVKRTPCELIESRNYICDTHWIVTEDGYILAFYHIINPDLIKANVSTIKPVILHHSLFGAADHFLINSEEGFAADWTNGEPIGVDLTIDGRDLPYLLANVGWDVWMLNARGCKNSRNHTTLNPDTDSQYWRFSYEQMISYDVPAAIDYVLLKTGYETVAWVGHSQGNLVLFGTLAEQPEYATKIKPFIALAPVTTVGHTRTPFRYIANIPFIQTVATAVGGELNIPDFFIKLFANKVCELTGVQGLCTSIFYLFGGYDPEQFNTTRLPLYISHGFEGTSLWNLAHFGQNIKNNRFAKYNFGLFGNLRQYGSFKPPEYDLGAIISKDIFLFYSANDFLADTADIEQLRKRLKVPFSEYYVENPKFSHLDFIWAKDVYTQVYAEVVKVLKRYR